MRPDASTGFLNTSLTKGISSSDFYDVFLWRRKKFFFSLRPYCLPSKIKRKQMHWVATIGFMHGDYTQLHLLFGYCHSMLAYMKDAAVILPPSFSAVLLVKDAQFKLSKLYRFISSQESNTITFYQTFMHALILNEQKTVRLQLDWRKRIDVL